MHTFANGVTFVTAGNQSVTATDSGNSVNGSAAVVANFVVSPFTAGDIVIYRVGIGGSYNITGASAPVFVDEYTPTGTFVQTVPMPVTPSGSNHALTGGRQCDFRGAVDPLSQWRLFVADRLRRAAGHGHRLQHLESRRAAHRGRDQSLGQRQQLDGADELFLWQQHPQGHHHRRHQFWVTGANSGVGYATLGSSTSTDIDPSDEQNLRTLQIVDGQLYVSSQKSIRVATVGKGVPTTPDQTITNLGADVPDNGSLESPNGFFLADLSPTEPGPDTLYLTDDNNGDIEKFSLDAGNWDFDGIIDADGIRGLTGSVNGSTVTLYGTTNGLDGESGTLYKFTDSSGFGGAVGGSASVILHRGRPMKRFAAWRWSHRLPWPRTS